MTVPGTWKVETVLCLLCWASHPSPSWRRVSYLDIYFSQLLPFGYRRDQWRTWKPYSVYSAGPAILPVGECRTPYRAINLGQLLPFGYRLELRRYLETVLCLLCWAGYPFCRWVSYLAIYFRQLLPIWLPVQTWPMTWLEAVLYSATQAIFPVCECRVVLVPIYFCQMLPIGYRRGYLEAVLCSALLGRLFFL